MDMILTTEGAAAANAAQIGGYRVVVSEMAVFRTSTPESSLPFVLNGSENSATIASWNQLPDASTRFATLENFEPINPDVVCLYGILNPDVGTFVYDAAVLYLEDGTPFAIGVMERLIEKVAQAPGVTPNRQRLRMFFRFAGASSILDVNIQNIIRPYSVITDLPNVAALPLVQDNMERIYRISQTEQVLPSATAGSFQNFNTYLVSAGYASFAPFTVATQRQVWVPHDHINVAASHRVEASVDSDMNTISILFPKSNLCVDHLQLTGARYLLGLYPFTNSDAPYPLHGRLVECEYVSTSNVDADWVRINMVAIGITVPVPTGSPRLHCQVYVRNSDMPLQSSVNSALRQYVETQYAVGRQYASDDNIDPDLVLRRYFGYQTYWTKLDSVIQIASSATNPQYVGSAGSRLVSIGAGSPERLRTTHVWVRRATPTESIPTVSVSSPVVNEGSSVTFTVNAPALSNGALVSWVIEGVSGGVGGGDFSTVTSGSSTIMSGVTTVNVAVTADFLTEGSEIFRFRLVDYPEANVVQVSIVDTSKAPEATITFHNSVGTEINSIAEGEDLQIRITYTNFPSPTLQWQITNNGGVSPITDLDFEVIGGDPSSTSLGGIETLSNPVAGVFTINRRIKADALSEGAEFLEVWVRHGSVPGLPSAEMDRASITIIDTSLNPELNIEYLNTFGNDMLLPREGRTTAFRIDAALFSLSDTAVLEIRLFDQADPSVKTNLQTLNLNVADITVGSTPRRVFVCNPSVPDGTSINNLPYYGIGSDGRAYAGRRIELILFVNGSPMPYNVSVLKVQDDGQNYINYRAQDEEDLWQPPGAEWTYLVLGGGGTGGAALYRTNSGDPLFHGERDPDLTAVTDVKAATLNVVGTPLIAAEFGSGGSGCNADDDTFVLHQAPNAGDDIEFGWVRGRGGRPLIRDVSAGDGSGLSPMTGFVEGSSTTSIDNTAGGRIRSDQLLPPITYSHNWINWEGDFEAVQYELTILAAGRGSAGRRQDNGSGSFNPLDGAVLNGGLTPLSGSVVPNHWLANNIQRAIGSPYTQSGWGTSGVCLDRSVPAALPPTVNDSQRASQGGGAGGFVYGRLRNTGATRLLIQPFVPLANPPADFPDLVAFNGISFNTYEGGSSAIVMNPTNNGDGLVSTGGNIIFDLQPGLFREVLMVAGGGGAGTDYDSPSVEARNGGYVELIMNGQVVARAGGGKLGGSGTPPMGYGDGGIVPGFGEGGVAQIHGYSVSGAAWPDLQPLPPGVVIVNDTRSGTTIMAAGGNASGRNGGTAAAAGIVFHEPLAGRGGSKTGGGNVWGGGGGGSVIRVVLLNTTDTPIPCIVSCLYSGSNPSDPFDFFNAGLGADVYDTDVAAAGSVSYPVNGGHSFARVRAL